MANKDSNTNDKLKDLVQLLEILKNTNIYF